MIDFKIRKSLLRLHLVRVVRTHPGFAQKLGLLHNTLGSDSTPNNR